VQGAPGGASAAAIMASDARGGAQADDHGTTEATLVSPPRSSPRTPPKDRRRGGNFFGRIRGKDRRGGAEAGQWKDDDPRHIANVIDTFQKFDANGSGKLDFKELRPALLALGMLVDDHDAIEILRNYDANGDGVLSVDEFATLVRQLLPRGQSAMAV